MPVRQRWLDCDPVRTVPRYADALRSLRAVWVDAGRADDYYLDLGAQAFVGQLDRIGVRSTFELFGGTHAQLDHRGRLALRFLAERLAR